jgi:hypothetical protein
MCYEIEKTKPEARQQGAHQRNEVEWAGESASCVPGSESARRGLK